jgi:SAM-dependent methyltransferase
MEALPYGDDTFDLVLHADTLEHIPDPVQGLRECLRVTRPGGHVCYTIPVVVGRPTRRRDALPESYHGSEGLMEYLVRTEYGDDFWRQPLEAGATDVRIVTRRYPASFAVVCRRAFA